MDLQSSVTGTEDLQKRLDVLPDKMRNRILRPALRDATQVVKQQAISNVRKVATAGYSKGLLEKSIVVRQLRTRNKNLRTAVAISPKRMSKAGVRVGLYGSVLEHGRGGGWSTHGKELGKPIKISRQPPKPWLRPSLSQSQSRVYSVLLLSSKSQFERVLGGSI